MFVKKDRKVEEQYKGRLLVCLPHTQRGIYSNHFHRAS